MGATSQRWRRRRAPTSPTLRSASPTMAPPSPRWRPALSSQSTPTTRPRRALTMPTPASPQGCTLPSPTWGPPRGPCSPPSPTRGACPSRTAPPTGSSPFTPPCRGHDRDSTARARAQPRPPRRTGLDPGPRGPTTVCSRGSGLAPGWCAGETGGVRPWSCMAQVRKVSRGPPPSRGPRAS